VELSLEHLNCAIQNIIARAFKLRYSEHINANWEMKQNCVGIGTLVKKRKPDWEL
jgi:hypothetical protein